MTFNIRPDEAENIVRDFIEEARGFPDGDWYDLRPTEKDLTAMEVLLNRRTCKCSEKKGGRHGKDDER